MQLSSAPKSKRLKIIQETRNAIADGDIEKALKTLAPLKAKSDNDPEVLMLFGLIAERNNMSSDALAWARKSLKLREHRENLLLAARTARNCGLTDEALDFIDRAEKHGVERRQLAVLRTGTLEEAGRFDEAKAIIEPVFNEFEAGAAPTPPAVLIEWAKLLVQFKEYDTAIKLIDRILNTVAIPEGAVSTMSYLKAKALDRAKRYDEAAGAAARGNAVNKVEFDPQLYTNQVTVLTKNWTRESMAEFPIRGGESPIPVFVAGMPRSGTSLIDQIIDAHPKAAGVGELSSVEMFAVELARTYDPEKPPARRFGKNDARQWTKAANKYVEQITKLAPDGAERIVNKALGNNKLVGLLARLFPNTRIIHAIRDPRDVAISCYMGGFNHDLIAWTTEVEWVAHSWAQSIRMMNHWKEATDVPILDVHYERLVADPENEMPRIIEFLGLEWDDACRDFYKSKRTVRTLSYDQVNRPLYTSSSGRHKNYADLIAGVEFPPYDPFADPPVAG